jgi:aminopeptidase N
MHRFDFERPLAPGARARLHFELAFANRGIDDGEPDDSIVGNGSYLMSFRCLPSLGYRRGYELRGARERRERGLSGTGRAILGEESEEPETDHVDLTATLSTSRDQTAITSGHLEQSWERDGRRYFRYKSDAPIFNRFAFASARYEVARRRHRPSAGSGQGIDVEVYYHRGHGINVERMLNTAVATLDYCEASFAPYPSRQLRIVELPSYWNFGGYAMPDLVFLVENRSFLIDSRDASRVDLVARRVAHEAAHQWWGHQLTPASVEGASMIVESVTKYGELMVLERMQGRERVRQLLEIELERYLAGRAREEESEPPLYKTGNSAYVYYSKGAIVLYAMRDLLGEEQLNRALRNLMTEYALHGGRATTLDLLRHVDAVAGPHKPLVDEWLKDITLYDFNVESATSALRTDGRYDVTIRVAAAKTRADGRGNESAMPLEEQIDIAIYDRDSDAPMHIEKRELRSGINTLTFVVAREPAYVAVDPYVSRIDKAPGDNSFGVR